MHVMWMRHTGALFRKVKMKNELNRFVSKISTKTFNVSMALLILLPQGWAIISAILLLEVSLFYFLLKEE